jgi:hypothetical protein
MSHNPMDGPSRPVTGIALSLPYLTGGSFPRGKAERREADHSPPISIETKKTWIYTSTPPYVFMA